MAWGDIGAATIDDEFKLLPNFYFDLHTEESYLWIILLTNSTARYLLAPRPFSRQLTKFSKDLYWEHLAQIQISGFQVDSGFEDPVMLGPLAQLAAAISVLNAPCTLL